jgi:26S proteasome regulatory subunit N11
VWCVAGFGTWMSGVDINTQQSFEALNPRAVAVVVDPVQSVKGKVVLEAFRLINPQMAMMGKEPRQHTGNIGFMQKPSRFAIVQGLNRHYYQVCVAYKKNDMEMRLLSNLHQKHW